MGSRKDTLDLLRRELEIEQARLEESSGAFAKAFELQREARCKMDLHKRVVEDMQERLRMLLEADDE